jgi:hypothetical protein
MKLINSSFIKDAAGTWHSIIVNLVREVISSVDPNVRGGDSLDIRPYVKLKIIPGELYYTHVCLQQLSFYEILFT